MAELLLHSMSEFDDLILSGLDIAGARNIVEIGAEYGGMSTVLADYVTARDGHLTCIDPAPKQEFLSWAAARPRVQHIPQPSLEAIGSCRDVDAWLIDGDHNWFTVYHELKAIDERCRGEARPLLIFLHDIGWPCARRDLYYAPDTIPERFRQPYSFDDGAIPGQTALVPGRGFRGMGAFAYATQEGGPRNGVLTAIEDFLCNLFQDGRELAFVEIPAVLGLGIVFSMDAPWSDALADLVVPYHQNPLIKKLEDNRLLNYLKVIDQQDTMVASAR